MSELIKDKALYEILLESLQNPVIVIHGIYEPDSSEPFGDCYYAAVDLFKPGLTFRIWFKLEHDVPVVEWAERWHFG